MILTSPVIFSLLIAVAGPLRYDGHELGETLERWEASTNFFAEKMAGCSSAKVRKAKHCSEWSDLKQQSDFHVTTRDKRREMSWYFSDALLTAIVINMPPLVYGAEWPDLEREAQLLVDVFGKPSEVSTVPYRNGYGAQFDAERLRWVREDGSVIVFEAQYPPGSRRGATKTLRIVFATAKAVADEEAQKHRGPNPYKQ